MSQEGVGAVLSQLRDGKEYVMVYYSAKLNMAERNYCITRKHLAIIMMEGLSFYHYGTRFTIRPDNATLRWLKTMKELEGLLAW